MSSSPSAPVPSGPALAAEFVLLAAIWGASFMFTRVASVAFGPLATAAGRVAIATAVLLPLLWWRGLLPLLRQHWRPLLAVGMLNSGLPFACYAFAVLYIPTGLSAILNATVPLFGAVVAWVWLRDALSPIRVAGLVVGFAGVAGLTLSQTGVDALTGAGTATWAVLACLLATFCYGVAASFTKRYLTGLPSLVTATGSQFSATLGLVVPAAFFWPAQTPPAGAWGALLMVGVVCTGLAYILYFRLIEAAGPARALTVTFLIPVFALGYGVALLGEPVTLGMVGWGLVVLAGTALSSGLVPARRST